MIPAGDPTEQAVQELLGLLEKGDVIVDGGNSNFQDSKRRAGVAAERASATSTPESPAGSGARQRLLPDGGRARTMR